MFFNELDLLEIRLNILDPYVDYFVLVESPRTHSNKPKSLYYEENKERFSKWNHKIIHLIFNDYLKVDWDFKTFDYKDKHPFAAEHCAIGEYPDDKLTPELAPYKYYWYNEQQQRAYLINGLKNCNDNDIVIVSDVDEIPNMDKIISYFRGNLNSLFNVFYCRQRMFYYYLNNEILSEWEGTYITKYKTVKDNKINYYRYFRHNLAIPDSGWHFSYLGDVNMIKQKLESYVHQENSDIPIEELEDIVETGVDIIRRECSNRVIDIDETYPEYIINNKEKLKKYIYTKT